MEAIVHKYPDRVLFLALDTLLGLLPALHAAAHHQGRRGASSTRTELRKGVEYVRSHPEVRDVLISGGDPLLLSDERLEELLAPLRAIPHVEMIRIGTRMPVCLPMRVTDALARCCAATRRSTW